MGVLVQREPSGSERAEARRIVVDALSAGHRVPDLAAKGIPGDLVDNMHEVRLVGNDSVHEGIAFSMEELDDIAGMIEEAVEVLWVQPARRAAMKAARDARRDAARAVETPPSIPAS